MARRILSIALLAFVIVALATVIVRIRTGVRAAPAPPPDGAATAVRPGAAVRLVAFYFHGTKRCASCTSLERLTREALKAETEAGAVEIRPLNVDEAPNAHFVEDFQLTMRTVVLAEDVGGRIVRWRRLDECWDRLGDPPGYLAYIRESLAGFRASAATAR